MSSCKKNEIMFFEGRDAMSLYVAQYEADSVFYSFASSLPSTLRDTVFVKIRTQGPARFTDRIIQLAPDSGTTAVLGEDYILPEFLFPAGSVVARYPVIVLRNSKLKEQTVFLNVMIKSSDVFEKGAIGQEINGSFSIARYKIKLNDYLAKPSYWDDMEWVVGEFSVTKLQFMFSIYGADAEFENFASGELLNMTLRLRAAQVEYEALNGPLIDENGNHVTF